MCVKFTKTIQVKAFDKDAFKDVVSIKVTNNDTGNSVYGMITHIEDDEITYILCNDEDPEDGYEISEYFISIEEYIGGEYTIETINKSDFITLQIANKTNDILPILRNISCTLDNIVQSFNVHSEFYNDLNCAATTLRCMLYKYDDIMGDENEKDTNTI